jgi:hypothetical protein
MHGEVLWRLHSRARGIEQSSQGAHCSDDAPVFDPDKDRAVWKSGLNPLVEEGESICPELFSKGRKRISDGTIRQLYGFAAVALILVPECFQQQPCSCALGGALKPDDPTGRQAEGGPPCARPPSQLA